MFGGFPGMGGGFGGGDPNQQQQGNNNMFGMMMNGMGGGFGAPPQQQQGFGGFGAPPQQQQGFGGFGAPQQQQQGFGGGGMMNPMAMMMGGGFGNMMGGGGQQQQDDPNNHGPFTHLFSDFDATASCPDFFPSTASTFRAKIQMEIFMLPGLIISGNMAYDLPNLRTRSDWDNGSGFEIENHRFGWKVKKESNEDRPKVTEIDPAKDTFPNYTVPPPPISLFEGTEKINGILCYRVKVDFFGLLSGRIWAKVPLTSPDPNAPKDESVPIYSEMNMMGMGQVRMLMTEHVLVDAFPDEVFYFDVTPYLPPKGPKGVVAGYCRDASNGRGVPNATVSFVPANGAMCTDAMTTKSDDKGHFKLLIPNTLYNVTYSCDKYTSVVKSVNVTGPIAAGTVADAFLSPVLEGPNLRFVLSWNVLPRDLDLYSHRDNGTLDCWFRNKIGSISRLDVDVTTSFGPESISTRSDLSEPLTIGVHQYTSGGKLAGCGAVVVVYDRTGKAHEITIPSSGEGLFWKVARIENGEVTVINQIVANRT